MPFGWSGGLTTGGGFGWLAGKYGLTCDNLLSAQVVTAGGRKLRASPDTNADLFWALRGGGGNFGIALQFEYALHPVTQVFGGMLCYPLSRSHAGFTLLRDFLGSAPDELTLSFGIRPLGRTSVFAIALCFCGDPQNARRLLQPLRSLGRASGALGPMPYLAMQSVMGESPPESPLYTGGGFMRELSDAAIDTITESAARNRSRYKLFWFEHYHGAMCRVAQDATAFSVREPGFGFLLQSEWSKPQDSRFQIEWVDDALEAMKPFASDIVYVANLGDEGPDRVRRCYGPNYPRLAAIKSKYDPDNLFRLNQNILPSSGPTAPPHRSNAMMRAT
jgi:hypothetical protein